MGTMLICSVVMLVLTLLKFKVKSLGFGVLVLCGWMVMIVLDFLWYAGQLHP